MLLLVVLLAQVVPPSDDRPPITPWGDIAGLQQQWEEMNSACRKLLLDSDEGQAVCQRRDSISSLLARLGYCVRQSGIQIYWDTCPRRGGR
jgi:hypothetical protein